MKARILVVEDEIIVQLDLETRLRRMGHVVVASAISGEEAITKAAEFEPDLVLMDVRLEGPMNGVEAASRICAARKVPVLFLTAHPEAPGEKPSVPLSPCVVKPFEAAQLQAAIVQALDNPAEA